MAVMVEQRSFRPFKSSEEYLWAMKEDLGDWLNNLYPDLYITAENFWDRLDNGVVLCQHTNKVREYAQKYVVWREGQGKTGSKEAANVLNQPPVKCFSSAKRETFFARDNVSNFITWCRKALNIIDCLLFETDDLILLKNEKNVILCLLELARLGSRLGMPAPTIVLLEKEIDKEIAREADEGVESGDDSGPEVGQGTGQIVTNDLRNLDDMVRVQVERCKCPTQFPMIRVSEGKYRIGDTKVLIFVRLLRNHVMVRVGGGWDTLAHYLDKHDPCRCRAAHRQTTGAKLSGVRAATPDRPKIEIAKAKITYERKEYERKETVWGPLHKQNKSYSADLESL
ncbi:hypothetical protein GE061_003767 [Apolygus lucorum]|uniref:GAR domain-containing protein n=1 Tax=Apolygus lucorum TaxID=248454 RepID=A0A6A4JRB3_APOLU|nr:hypothetical protein GE061_003767 [Apolygus lucorum]